MEQTDAQSHDQTWTHTNLVWCIPLYLHLSGTPNHYPSICWWYDTSIQIRRSYWILNNRTIKIFQIVQPRPNHSATWDESGQRLLMSPTISVPTEIHPLNPTKKSVWKTAKWWRIPWNQAWDYQQSCHQRLIQNEPQWKKFITLLPLDPWCTLQQPHTLT